MKNSEDYYGIYIDNKIPKFRKDEKKECNKYFENVKLKFDGKAFIVEDEKETELDNNEEIKKSGKHIIKFINEKNEIFYIDILIRKLKFIWLFFIIFLCILCGLLFLKNDNMKKYKIAEFSNFDLDLEGLKYVFNINYGNTNFQDIELIDTIKDSKFIYPGTHGCFYIQISTKNGNRDMLYEMQIKEELNKPNNLKFQINGEQFNSMKELAESINGIIKRNSNKVLKIDWEWQYESDKGDQVDTTDGESLDNYKVLMRIVGSEKL